MEGVTMNMYRNLKGFWRRRGYQRLNAGGGRRRRTRGDLGAASADPSRKRRRFWKIRIMPRLRLVSPRKLLIKLRDGYVNFMLRIASSSAIVGAGGGFGAVDFGVGGFGMRPMKEYDEKVIVEIYKSLMMAQRQQVPRDAANNNSHVVPVPHSK